MKGSKDQSLDDTLQVSKKRKREKPLIERLPPSDSEYNCKFARALGSVDWQTRDKGLQALTIWLSRNTVSDEDLTKIWKALFFCFWHSDKAPVQAELAQQLAAILPKLTEQGALQYFRIFARTMQREWFGIDKLRLDKFMMLARKFLHQLYTHLQNTGWDLAATAACSNFIVEEVLAPSDADPSAGFSLHVADLLVQELISACEGSPVPAPALQALLEPWCRSLAHTKRAALLSRLQDGVFEPLLDGRQYSALAELDIQQLATCLFDLGAQEGVRARNRQICYALTRALEKAGSKRQKREARGLELQPQAQLSGGPLETQQPGRSAPASVSAENGAAVRPPAPQAAKPTVVSGKKQKKAVARQETRDAALSALSHRSVLQSLKQPGSAKQGNEKQQASLAQLPQSALNTNNGSAVQKPAPEVSKASSQEPNKFLGSAVSQEDAARLLNAALNGHAEPGSMPAHSNGLGSSKAPADGTTSMKKLQKKRRQSLPPARSAVAALAQRGAASAAKPVKAKQDQEQASMSPAAGKPAASARDGLTDSQHKKVKFALKKNLYFAKGGPVPPPDVRTPPTAKPKGSALKKSSTLAKSPRSPKSFPRAKAALFF